MLVPSLFFLEPFSIQHWSHHQCLVLFVLQQRILLWGTIHACPPLTISVSINLPPDILSIRIYLCWIRV